ncbi:MAG: Gfo/Idh/MocA family oxidoreductase [Lachnospiraceae bacterium]|nr:Gfo/Idh/MocA family oxidoreductase [Lachnospiraceae bacterium]
MSKKLRVAVVGVGGISGAHIPSWMAMDDVELKAICDIRPEMMEKYPEVRHYTDCDEMLDKEELDVLDICLPTFLHVEYALKGIEHGLHVITEKPVSLHEDDPARVYKAAKEHGVQFMVAHCLRFWPAYCYVKEAYDSGRYGKLLSASMWRLGDIPLWTWDDWMRDEKRSGFIPYDLHIHDLDFMIYAFGAPKTVSCRRSKEPDQDYLTALYDYGDFFITCESSWYKARYPFTSGFRFQFENALLVNADDVFSIYDTEGNVLHPLASADDSNAQVEFPTSDAYFNEILYFKNCLMEGRPVDIMNEEQLTTVIHILNSFPGAINK